MGYLGKPAYVFALNEMRANYSDGARDAYTRWYRANIEDLTWLNGDPLATAEVAFSAGYGEARRTERGPEHDPVLGNTLRALRDIVDYLHHFNGGLSERERWLKLTEAKGYMRGVITALGIEEYPEAEQTASR